MPPLAETVIAAKLLRDAAVGRPHVSASLDRVLQILVGHLQDRHGIVVLTGPEGSGKTIALRQLAIDAEPGIVAKTISATPRTTAEDLYKAVLEALKAAPSENEAPLARIRRVLSPVTMPYPALLVDDAEKLSPSALAALAELAAPGKGFPAVTVLLATRQASSELLRGRTLVEAVVGTIAMPRLSPGQVEHFLRSRLRAARLPLETFPGPVMEALGDLSGGLPGPLTRLASEALERAVGAGRSTVTLADIADGTAPATPSAPLPPPVPPAAAPEEAALEKALRAAVEDARPASAPASSGLPPITIAPRPNERPPHPAPSPPSAAGAAPPPTAASRQLRRTALMASAVAAVALVAVATPVLLLGPRVFEHQNDPVAPAPGPTALVLPSGGSDATNLPGPREEDTTAAMPAAAPRPSPDGASPAIAADAAPVVETAAPSAPPARVTEEGPPEPPPFPAAEPVGGTLPNTLSAAESSRTDPVLLPVAATPAASEPAVGEAAARAAAEPASPEAPSAVESTAPPDPPAALENAVADAAVEPPPPPAAIEETDAAELPDSPAPAPLATTEPAEIADADSPSPSAPLPEPPEAANAPEASANADAAPAAEPSPPATAEAAVAAEIPASPEPGAQPPAEPAERTAAEAPETSPPPAQAVAAEAAEPPVAREAAAGPPALASVDGDETSAGSAEPAPVAATEPSEPAEAVPPEPAASAVAVASKPAAAESAAADSAAATIDAIVGAPPRDEPFDPEALAQLFREAEAAIAAAEAARAGTAPHPAEMAELDPDLRRLFEQFLQSLEATPREADAAERSLYETFQLFLARNAHLFGKAVDPAGDPAMKATR